MHRIRSNSIWAIIAFVGLWHADASAEGPTAEYALTKFTPVQPNVDYDRPTKAEMAKCTIRPEKLGGATAWIVRNEGGEMLRRFADSDGDNVVDQWCYFKAGLESYRDIDSDFNETPDQYRWFQTSGTRWGIDRNEDKRIDYWKVISAPEVAEELVWAIKAKDRARFELLLLTPAELKEIGFGKAQLERVTKSLQEAPAAFSKLSAEQEVISRASEFVDFYRSRPATIPAGTEDSSKDITVHDNASALVETGDKHDQLYLGTLVAVGNTWKMLDVPTLGSDAPMTGGLLMAGADSARDDAAENRGGGPSAELEKMMAALEKLDEQAVSQSPEEQAGLTDRRADLLLEMIDASTDVEMRETWIRQLADVLSSAIQSGEYPAGIERIDQLVEKLSEANSRDPMIAYVQFRRMWADYVSSQQSPDADFAKIQEKWLADLEEFAKAHPRSPDAAEALLQLGMSHEFANRLDPAQEWYRQLVKDFPKSAQAAKAAGALRRLGSVGKPIRFQARDVRGNPIDLNTPPYRGKVVLIQYWATWYERCKTDMDALNDLYAKYGGRGGFEIIGVCLDKNPQDMRRFLTENRYLWRQVHEPDGIDGRLANEMGVMTLPLMVLVDQKGNVVDDNIFVTEVGGELARLLGTATAQGAAGAIPNR